MVAHLSADLFNVLSSSSSRMEHTVCIVHGCEHRAQAGRKRRGLATPFLEHVPPALRLGSVVWCLV
jgi:hypothetical protein